jgi:hypothetical protein
VLRHLLHGDLALADRRIVDGDVIAADLREHHEMVVVPMQDAGQLQLGQMLQIEPQRPCGHLEFRPDAHEIAKGEAFQRNAEAPPDGRQVQAMTVMAGHHRETGQAAFRRLGLDDDGSPRGDVAEQTLTDVHGKDLSIEPAVSRKPAEKPPPG